MESRKTARIVSNLVYIIGTIAVCGLTIYGVINARVITNPDAMLPMTGGERSTFFLAFGTVPMLSACMAVYKFNMIKSHIRKTPVFILVFLPSSICLVCFLFIVGSIIAAI